MSARSNKQDQWIDLGFFRRDGQFAEGLIGPMLARFDRHRGGLLELKSSDTTVSPVRLAARVRVVSPGAGQILLSQEADPDPRLIVAEQGPVRIWMRVMFSLLDGAGNYHGDGLTDAIIYRDGEVRLALALRLVDARLHESITDAWIEMTCGSATGGTVGGKKPAPIRLAGKGPAAPAGQAASYSFRDDLPRQYVALSGRRGGLAVGYYSLDGRAEDKLGQGVGTWHGPRNQAPWYDTWGHLYDQWQGLAGWGGHQSGRLVIAPAGEPFGAGGSLGLNWHWLHEASEPCGASFGMRALLGLYFDRDAGSAVTRLTDSFKPILPKVCAGQFRFLDVVENTLVCQSCECTELSFAKTRRARSVRIRAYGFDGRGGIAAHCDDQIIHMQQLSHGGQTDDPYGPNLARPGDRFATLLGDHRRPAGEAVFTVTTSIDEPASVFVHHGGGGSFSYLKWDNRQLYVLWDMQRAENWPIATFSPLTLCLHDVTAGALRWPGSTQFDPAFRTLPPEPGIVRLPLYWYPCNVQTRGHCANQPEAIQVKTPVEHWFEFALRIVSSTPGRSLRSTVTAAMPPAEPQTQFDVACQLEVLSQYDLPEIQFVNVFPYNSWRTEDWQSDWVVTLDDADRQTTYFVKEPRGQSVLGDQATHWDSRFFLAQGARERGNILVLCSAPEKVEHKHRYVLCRCWLDSHFSIDQLGVPSPAGTKLSMNYSAALFGDRRLSRAEALRIGQHALRTGKLLRS